MKVVENYIEQSIDQKSENLRSTRFRKTWFIRDGKNAGKGTIKAPFHSNPELRLLTRRLLKSELDRLLLANSMILSPQGYLSKNSLNIAIKLPIPFASMQTIDDEEEHLQGLRQANALFTYAQRTLCTCALCALCFTTKQNKTTWQTRSIQQGSNLLKQLAAPYRGQAEYQRYRLNTSEESSALESCGTDWEYLRPDGVFRGRCLPARWCTAQSKKATDVSPRGFTVL